MLRRLMAALFALALLAAGCGSDGSDESDGGDDTGADAPAADDGADDAGDDAAADLQLASSELGDILVDASGNVLYLFVPDAQGESTCYDQCEVNWPVVGELATVGEGLDAGLLGTTERTNGDVQATYNGWPLYYFINDAAPGDTNGQGANDVWYVMDAAGNAVGAE